MFAIALSYIGKDKMKGTELRRIRISFKLSQTQWAYLLGYTSFQRISQMETGKEPIPKQCELLVRMYSEFGIPERMLPVEMKLKQNC